MRSQHFIQQNKFNHVINVRTPHQGGGRVFPDLSSLIHHHCYEKEGAWN